MIYKMRRLPSGDCQVLICFPLSAENVTPDRAASLGWGWGSLKKAVKRAYKIQKRFLVIATSPRVAGALYKAAKVATEVAKNPALAAMLPPGTAQALKIAMLASRAAQDGKLPALLAKLKGPGSKRLLLAIAKMQKAK